MTQSILTSVKKILGIAEDDDSFDIDIIIHINSVFSILNQLGIGPEEGFEIEDATTTWDAFVSDKRLVSVKTYVYLRVRLLFDPPNTSYVIESANKQISEIEWRLSVQRESTAWVDPNPQPATTGDGW